MGDRQIQQRNNVIDLCNRAVDAVKELLSAGQFRDVHEYINRYDEWGLGMEVLIDQLIELDVKISPAQFEQIRAAMASMGIDDCDRLTWLLAHAVTE